MGTFNRAIETDNMGLLHNMADDVFKERLRDCRKKILKGMDLEALMGSCADEGISIENKIAQIIKSGVQINNSIIEEGDQISDRPIKSSIIDNK